jgi:G-rich domain on putative tyrosine kinase
MQASPESTGMTSVPTASPTQWFEVTARWVQRVRTHWLTTLAFTMAGAIAAGGTVIVLPSYYQAGAAFQAETNTAPVLSGTLAGLASQIGNLPIGTQTSAQFFGDLLGTYAVLRRVARDTFAWKGHPVGLSAVYGYDDQSEDLRVYKTVRRLRRALGVDVNVRTGVVRFTLEGRTPELAKALAESTLAALNIANIALRQKRAAAERAFTAERAEHAHEELASAEQVLAAFYQRNRSIANSPSLQVEEGQLRRQVDMAQQVYVQLRLQEEQAAVQEVRNTPAISVIDPPVLPVKRSWPRRQLAVVLGALIGFAIGSVRLLAAP